MPSRDINLGARNPAHPQPDKAEPRTRSSEPSRGTERPCPSDDRQADHLDRATIVAGRTPPDDAEMTRSPWDGSFPMSIAPPMPNCTTPEPKTDNILCRFPDICRILLLSTVRC